MFRLLVKLLVDIVIIVDDLYKKGKMKGESLKNFP